MIDELGELEERLQKLLKFVDSGKVFTALPAAEQERMRRQVQAMLVYSNILREMIEAFVEAAQPQEKS